jgi:hypothetical protein
MIVTVSLLLLLSLAGCADEAVQPVTLGSWRRGVEQYVWDRGNGDPNVLADVSWDDVHKGFAIIGDPLPDRSTDLIGLLVGHRRIEGRPCFLFLLATVRQEHLESLRPVSLQVNAGEFHWSIGEPASAPLAMYRSWSDASRRLAQPADPHPPPFPRPGDEFDVAVAAQDVTILHQQTGAAWSLHVPAAASTTTSPAR